MPKILMIAAEFPPCQSAGVQRTYHFSESLLQHDWLPLILSAHPRIYRRKDFDITISREIQEHIRYAFAVDAAVHLAIKGKYFGFMEDPDKIASWYHHGWRVGMSIIIAHNPDVIWSTFPISTAHRIGLKLKLKTGKPWVADFRDPLHSHCDNNFKNISSKAKDIDARTLQYADLVVFATGKMRDLYAKAYPDTSPEKLCVIENGFDEKGFGGKGIKLLNENNNRRSIFTLLYSGGLYQIGRDPIPLFNAVSQLNYEGNLGEIPFKLVFRGAGDGGEFTETISALNLTDIVEFLPSVSHDHSIQEMKSASALLVLQGEVFNYQIPGKVYEYIATGRPILSLLGKEGATFSLLESVSGAHLAAEKDIAAIKQAIRNLLIDSSVVARDVNQFTRGARAKELLVKLNELVDIN